MGESGKRHLDAAEFLADEQWYVDGLRGLLLRHERVRLGAN